jgi:peptidoglycan/LPS O-acetylase OafA/YrhL
MANNRRYDIDWLRVIAIGLLVIYHVTIGFQPWGVFIGFIQNNETLTWIWTPMAMLNIWRIPLLFFVSGMGVYFAIQRRDWKALLIERSRRILLPLIFGMAAIVPLHLFLWQNYYNQDLVYNYNPAHLWFLGNIFVYVLLFFPLFYYLKNHQEGKIHRFMKKILAHPIGLLLVMIPFIAEAELLQPESFEFYAMNAHGFWMGMIAFLVGFCCVYSGITFWNNVAKWRWLMLAIASILFALRVLEGEFNAPYYLKAIESNLWIFTVFGFGYKYLNKPSSLLSYLSQAAYPVYILHMVFLYLGSWLLFPVEIPAIVKLISVTVFTLAGCFATYELLVKRIPFLRLLFGLKIQKLQEAKNVLHTPKPIKV